MMLCNWKSKIVMNGTWTKVSSSWPGLGLAFHLSWTMCISEVKDKHRNVPPFSLPLFIFVRVVFSVLQCITWHYPSKFELQSISWKQFRTERSCQADKTLPLSFTLKCCFFLHPKYTRQPNCWHVCEERWSPAFFHAPLCKTGHCLFKEHRTL